MKFIYNFKKKDRKQKSLIILIAIIAVLLPIIIFLMYNFSYNIYYNRALNEMEIVYKSHSEKLFYSEEAIESGELATRLNNIVEREIEAKVAYVYLTENNNLNVVAISDENIKNAINKRINDNEAYYKQLLSLSKGSISKVKNIETIVIPFINPDNDKMVFAVDYDNSSWLSVARANSIIVSIVFLVIMALLLVIELVLRKNKEIIETQNTFQSLVEEMNQGFAVHEIIYDENKNPVDFKYLSVNSSFEKLIGFKEKDIIGKRLLEIFPQTDKSWMDTFVEVSKNHKHMRVENYSKILSKYLEVYAYTPTENHMVLILTDITNRKHTEKLLYDEKVLLETTLISVGDGVISTDKDGNIILMNEISEILTGFKKDEAIGEPLTSIFRTLNEATNKSFNSEINNIVKSGEIFEFSDNTILISKNEIETPIEGIVSPIRDQDKNNGVVLVFRDYTEQRKKNKEIEYLSFHDKLTGLYNRRFFDEEFKRIDTKRNYPISVVMADLNGLKLVNDAFGHANGDQLLVEFSNAIKAEYRADDIIARIGGDEFVLLLPKTEEEEANNIISRMKDNLKDKFICDINITAAFGYGLKHSEKVSLTNVLQSAEVMMYKDKLKNNQELKKETVDIIHKQLHDKNPIEKRHSENVADLCEKMGIMLQLNNTEIKTLKLFGFLHNIGKITIDPKIFSENAEIGEKERLEIKKHTEIGYQILSSVNEYSDIANYVLEHHERWDGSGYPRGLVNNEISIQARILAVVEAYDRMVNNSYKKNISMTKALKNIVEKKSIYFDPHIVDIFIEKVI